MTMLPMYKICPICKKRYSWNPDVGRMFCPRCKVATSRKCGEIIWNILKRKK